MVAAIPEAFVHSITHLFGVESGAVGSVSDSIAAVTHPTPLNHPWPRQFRYHAEVFSIGGPPIAPLDVQAALSMTPADFVMTVFGGEAGHVRAAWEAAGYTFAWSNELMSADVGPPTTGSASNAEVVPVRTVDQIEEANRIGGDRPLVVATLQDDRIHDRVARLDGDVVGTAQLVTADPTYGYVSDMYVDPEHRGTGIGRALMHDLHTVAREHGRGTTILVPSRMAREISFYERFGYAAATEMHLFIPTEAGPSDVAT